MSPRLPSSLAAVVSIALAASPAAAQEAADTPVVPREEGPDSWGMAEFGLGILTLPDAEVCVESTEGCSRGDRTLAVSAWPMFRWRRFAVGAGVTLGLTPTTDAPRDDPPDLPRDHSRSYLTVETTGRYYLPLDDSLDGWLGVNVGLVIVNDTFQSQAGLGDRAVVGPQGATLLTEGGTVGVGGGLQFIFAESWLVGGGVRVSNWFLPTEPQKDPIGDEASLRGRVTSIELGLSLAYRSRFIF